jgi:hypothetical protein
MIYAKQLIKLLEESVKIHGDLPIILTDSEGDFMKANPDIHIVCDHWSQHKHASGKCLSFEKTDDQGRICI